MHSFKYVQFQLLKFIILNVRFKENGDLKIVESK